jgi:hypothetical protein
MYAKKDKLVSRPRTGYLISQATTTETTALFN